MTGRDSELEDYREKLDRTVGQLQRQTSLPHWIFAHSDALTSAAVDLPFHFGPRGRMVHWVFNRTGRTLASFVALWIVGSAVIVKWWIRAMLAKTRLASGVFVGMGAGSEEHLFERFKAETDGFAMHVQHDAPRTFGRVCAPSLANLLDQLWAECRKVYSGLRESSQAAIAERLSMWMTIAAMRVGNYTFVKTWAAQLPPTVKRVVFIAVDVQCFAAVDGRRGDQDYTIEYWQHGLHRRGLLIPAVDRILALNYAEGRQMSCLSGRPFEVVGVHRATSAHQQTDTLLFASIYTTGGFDKRNHIAQMQQLFVWARSRGLSIVIRPHPREDRSFWTEHFPELQLDTGATSFEHCIQRWRPALVASWFSTALLDALRLGIAPVLLTEGSAPFLRDMVLPLDRVALRWPEESATIENIARDPAEYRRWVGRRWEEVFAPDAVVGMNEVCSDIAGPGPAR